MTTATIGNGRAAQKQLDYSKIEEKLLGEPLTTGYRSSSPTDFPIGLDGWPLFTLHRDIAYMLRHPIVRSRLNYFKAGIAGAEFWGGEDLENPDNDKGRPICPDNLQVGAWVKEQCERYWDRGVPKLQRGYDFGWVGAECLYKDDRGFLQWDDLLQFSPNDAFLLTQTSKPVGVRVKNVREASDGKVDLWLASEDVPAKGLWYAHCPLDGAYYGQSQLYGAWRPWRRLAWKDGAETVLDGGVYRYAYAGPIVKYPMEDLQAQDGSAATTADSEGYQRRYARDWARQFAEQAKTGVGIGVPSGQYPKEMGGGPKWEITMPASVLNCDPIINYVKQLHDDISYGVGVPPEVLEAAETGSGYSGRRVPMEAFLETQQQIGDYLLCLFVEQVLRPLALWNFGDVRFEVKMKRLLKTKNKAQAGQAPGPGQQPQDGQPRQNGQPGGQPGQPAAKGGRGWKDGSGGVHYGQLSLEAGDDRQVLITDKIRDAARLALRGVVPEVRRGIALAQQGLLWGDEEEREHPLEKLRG